MNTTIVSAEIQAGTNLMGSKTKKTRRRWSEAFKKRVVAEASQPGASLAKIAHRYDLNTGRVSRWKKRFGIDAALLPVAPPVLNGDNLTTLEVVAKP